MCLSQCDSVTNLCVPAYVIAVKNTLVKRMMSVLDFLSLEMFNTFRCKCVGIDM